MYKSILIILLSSLLLNAFSLKDKYDLGDMNAGYKYAKQEFDKKNYENSAQILFELIQKGNNPEAFRLFGYQIEFGLGIEQDCKVASSMYFNSIKSGDCSTYKDIIRMVRTNHCIKKSKNNKRTLDGLDRSYQKCKNKKIL